MACLRPVDGDGAADDKVDLSDFRQTYRAAVSARALNGRGNVGRTFYSLRVQLDEGFRAA